MPTVKLHSSGKVILKDGKVSCACCGGPEPEECCMYEAGLLDDTYTVDDLPDAILIDGENANKVSSIPNRGSIEVGYWKGGTPADGDYCVAHTGDTSWRFEQYNGNSEEWNEIGESSGCLFGGLFKPSGYLVEDQFADCYEISFDLYEWDSEFGEGAFWGSYTGQLTRVSLCIWEGLAEDEFDNAEFIRLENVGAAWEVVNEGGATATKERPWNQPDGNYENETGGGGTIMKNVVVSPC
jgi:hypothetical protein